jgi:hypothetical protein
VERVEREVGLERRCREGREERVDLEERRVDLKGRLKSQRRTVILSSVTDVVAGCLKSFPLGGLPSAALEVFVLQPRLTQWLR